tara:strand:+ start:1037 stop:1372 length:336 start_codon:yes stop_codon:yes gene_type:complete
MLSFLYVKKECSTGKVLNPKTNRCIKDIPICGQDEVLRDGKCVCGKNIYGMKKNKNVYVLHLLKELGIVETKITIMRIISKFPKIYKVYLNIPYKNKDLGVKWDYTEKIIN